MEAMRVEPAFVGARIIDSLPFSQAGTASQARALRASGVDGVVGYLGAMTRPRLDAVLDAGLGFMPVTLAEEYADGPSDELAQLGALGIPAGTSVWLDLEGPSAFRADPLALAGTINVWADRIREGGFMPCLYVGAPQPFTSRELYALRVVRYWWGLGRCVDRSGQLAEPTCGWCMVQQFHGQPKGLLWKDTGVLVDTNGVQCDYFGRLPAWIVRGRDVSTSAATRGG